MAASIDLVEVGKIAVGAPRPRLRGSKTLPGNTVMATGSEISVVFSTAESVGLRPPPYSQYSRADETALLVSQYKLMSSSTSSGDFSGSLLLYVQCVKPG
jgi:hypothetical protein